MLQKSNLKTRVASALGVAGLLALSAFRLPLADDNPIRAIAQKLGDYYGRTQPQKLYLHFDRPAYGTGETVWFSAYLVDAQRYRADSLGQVLHVELLSPQRSVVLRRTLKLEAGRAYGDFDLADSLQAGTYLLRAYTNWMRNAGPDFVFQRQLQVWPASPDAPDAAPATANAVATGSGPRAGTKGSAPGGVDVQFFPEGGSLVAGLPAVVGYKAVAATGRGASISGQVLDEQNKPVVQAFASAHLGMGHLGFVPAAGHTYHAHVRLPSGSAADYPLPAVEASGYALRITDNGSTFTVEARYKGAVGAPLPSTVALLTDVRGFIVGLAPRALAPDGTPVQWQVAKARYPTGIMHLTLFDGQSTPLAERLAFVQNGPPALQVALSVDKAAYAPHDPVHVKVQVSDAAGQPVATRFSVSVADANSAALDPNAGNVTSSLLLTSDLAGYVESPGYYFQSQSAATSQALDDLLLTQGWRRYVWKEVLATPPPPLAFAPESSITLAGYVTGMGQRGIANSQLTFIQTKPRRNFLTANTTADGFFRFTGFPGTDTSVVTLQARRTSGGSNVIIRPDTGPATKGPALPQLPTVEAAPPGVADYLRRSRRQQVQERQNNPEAHLRNVQLANVAVTGKRSTSIVPPDDSRRLYPGVVANTIVDFTDLPAARSGIPVFSILQGRVAGLAISGSPPDQTIQIRNQGTPQFLLDGVRVEADVINTLSSTDVEAVEVFKGTEGAIFGSNGGVIAVYTKRGNPHYKAPASREPSTGIAVIRVPGYYQAREFYQPRYGAPVMNAPATDPRQLTIYWNPELQTNAAGQADFTFFTADGSGDYQVSAEGISLSGLPSQGSTKLYVAPRQR